MKRRHLLATGLCSSLIVLLGACAPGNGSRSSDAVGEEPMPEPETPATPDTSSETGGSSTEVATFGAGCYWCVEAVLEQIDGVQDVTSGFMGGDVPNPSYRDVCTGRTGHAEVVQVTFDPDVLPYEELLDWFWRLHDPTTLNRQGADVGTQYRSAIFYHSEAQREAAEKSKREADASGVFSDPIVTEITAAGPYYQADEYHQDYYRQNKEQGYCRVVIRPKLEKLGLEK
jgi:peptide-methionine (S)-S-oxide reductase